MKKVLVTGGTGFIGAQLIKVLLERGYNVRAFDNNFRGGLDKLKGVIDDVELIEGDIRDTDAVANAVKGMEIIYHMAFINGTRFFYEKPDLVLEVGLKGTINVMDACAKHGVERYLFASSSEVYQQPTHIPTKEDERLIVSDPHNPRYSYGGAKIIGEIMALHYAKSQDMETVIFRPHNIYGPSMGFEHVIPEFVLRLKKISQNFTKKEINFPIQGTGEETRSFCYVKDAAEGILIVGEKGVSGEIYNVGTQQEITIKYLAQLVAKELDLKISIKPTHGVKGGTNRRCPSIEKLGELGYCPQIQIEEGLKPTCQWYREVEK